MTPKNRAQTSRWEQVFDASGRRSRGIWKRGKTFYVQCRTKDPQTGLIAQDRHALFGARTEPQARKLAEAVKIKAASGEIYRKQGFPTLAEYIPHYLANCHKGDHTIDNERGYLKMWLTHLGNIRLSQITAAAILSYRTKALAEEGVSERTVNVRVNALKSLLKFAKQEEKLEKLPTDGIKELHHEYRTKRLLSKEQVEGIISIAEQVCPRTGRQFADFVKLAAYSGGRNSEVLQLQWENVDFSQRLLHFETGTTKGGKGRAVDFNPNLEAHLREMAARKTGSPWLFPSPRTDTRVTTFKKALEKVRRKLGVDFSAHSFRHYFCSMCVMSGVDFLTIAKWVGHRDGGVLIGKVYGHTHDQHRKEMAAKLTNL
jgi:integrase